MDVCQGHIIRVNRKVLIDDGSFPKDTRNLLHWRSTEESIPYIGMNDRGIPGMAVEITMEHISSGILKISLLHIHVLLTSHGGTEFVVLKHLNCRSSAHDKGIAF